MNIPHLDKQKLATELAIELTRDNLFIPVDDLEIIVERIVPQDIKDCIQMFDQALEYAKDLMSKKYNQRMIGKRVCYDLTRTLYD